MRTQHSQEGETMISIQTTQRGWNWIVRVRMNGELVAAGVHRTRLVAQQIAYSQFLQCTDGKVAIGEFNKLN